MPKSPKQRFLESTDAKAWADATASRIFETASDFAMLQVVENLSGPVQEQIRALADHYRLEGAKMYANTLARLADKVEMPKQQPQGTLDHRA